MKLFGQESLFKAIVEKLTANFGRSAFYFKNVDLAHHKKIKFKNINGVKTLSIKDTEAFVAVPNKAKFGFAMSKNYIGLAWQTTARYGFTIWNYKLVKVNSVVISKKSLPKELRKRISQWDNATLLNLPNHYLLI